MLTNSTTLATGGTGPIGNAGDNRVRMTVSELRKWSEKNMAKIGNIKAEV